MRVKVFKPFEDSSMHFSMINAILIYFGCVLIDQVSHLWKALSLNLSKKQETYLKIGGRVRKNL